MNDTNNPENTLPSMPKITTSVAGIQQQLSLLDTNPGMSDHEAVVFYFGADSENANTKSEHKVALYHKANLENIKRELLEFHNCFFKCDPYT